MADLFRECYANCFKRAWERRAKAEIENHPFCLLCEREDCTFDVHHMTYIHRGHELSYELAVLCRECHDEVEELKPALYGDSFEIVIWILEGYVAELKRDAREARDIVRYLRLADMEFPGKQDLTLADMLRAIPNNSNVLQWKN